MQTAQPRADRESTHAPPSTTGPAAFHAPASQPAALDGAAYLRHRLLLDLVRGHFVGSRVLMADEDSPRGATSARILQSMKRSLKETLITCDEPGQHGDAVDLVLALGSRPHAAPVSQKLSDWASRLVDGGRLIVELRSAEHQQACPARGSGDTRPSTIAAAELVQEAAQHGLCVRAAIPYGLFLCDGGHSRFLGDLPTTAYFRRLLSWLSEDRPLLELALLIEQDIVAHLSPRVTDRFVAVFEKRSDAAAVSAWLHRLRASEDRLCRSPLDLSELQLGRPLPALRQHVSALLNASLRCRRLFDAVATPLVARGGAAWRDLVEPPLDSYFLDVARHRELDRYAMQWSRQAGCQVPGVAPIFQHADVPLGRALEYSLVEPLLTQGFGRFTGVRT